MAAVRDAFFIGRGLDYSVCLEGQLKLKEISYLHAEAYPAGELKHGTLALIEPGIPVVAVITQPGLVEKSISNVRETLARGADVTAVVSEDLAELVRPHARRLIIVPAAEPCAAACAGCHSAATPGLPYRAHPRLRCGQAAQSGQERHRR